MDEDINFILIIAGIVIVTAIGFVAYKFISQRASNEIITTTIPVTLFKDNESPGSITTPTNYYQDIQSEPVSPVPYVSSIVQNTEEIKWTDWLGRERIITITRKVH